MKVLTEQRGQEKEVMDSHMQGLKQWYDEGHHKKEENKCRKTCTYPGYEEKCDRFHTPFDMT